MHELSELALNFTACDLFITFNPSLFPVVAIITYCKCKWLSSEHPRSNL